MTGSYKYGYIVRTYQTDFITEPVCLEDDTLLEIRMFDENGEYRAYRSSIDSPFKEREIYGEKDLGILPDGAIVDGRFIFDEAMYLDKDDKRSTDDVIFATGGGSYHLPSNAKDKDMFLVRYYCDFDEDGAARITDWRLRGFINSGEWKGAK